MRTWGGVRRVFQPAVIVPHHHLDGLWRDYQRFENDGPNKQFAKKYGGTRVTGPVRRGQENGAGCDAVMRLHGGGRV